jgi:hypothetical protein
LKVFISWSGPKSLKVAELLHAWLPNLFASTIEPWISSKDIKAGQRGTQEIAEQLKDSGMGIISLTNQNLVAPWIQFEAGALSKFVDRALVCTYLVDLEVSDLDGANPLAQFQWSKADRDGTRKIVKTINDIVNAHATEKLTGVFEKWWPELEGELKNLPPDGELHVQKRSESEILEELLALARRQAYHDSVMPEILSNLQQVEKELEQQRAARLFNEIAESAAARSEMIRSAAKKSLGGRYRRGASLAGKPQEKGGLGSAAVPGYEAEKKQGGE